MAVSIEARLPEFQTQVKLVNYLVLTRVLQWREDIPGH